jgi:predicted acetyltransferase
MDRMDEQNLMPFVENKGIGVVNIIDSEKKLFMRQIDEKNIFILLNLGQAYEAEFSYLTKKVPDADGLFTLDTIPVSPYAGYLIYQHNTPIGFCIINIEIKPMYIAEFYIVPSKRLQAIGMDFAHAIFRKYPGLWQVSQIKGADQALKFWKCVISGYTSNNYKDEVVEDPDWGIVTRQTFLSVCPKGI